MSSSLLLPFHHFGYCANPGNLQGIFNWTLYFICSCQFFSFCCPGFRISCFVLFSTAPLLFKQFPIFVLPSPGIELTNQCFNPLGYAERNWSLEYQNYSITFFYSSEKHMNTTFYFTENSTNIAKYIFFILFENLILKLVNWWLSYKLHIYFLLKVLG